MTNPKATPNLPCRTLHSLSAAALASARVAPGCSRKTACVSASRPGIPKRRYLKLSRRRMACVDTPAMPATRRLWHGCSGALSKTSGRRGLSCITSMAGFPAFSARALSKPIRAMALETLRNAAFTAFLVGQQAARLMLENEPDTNGAKGTIIFTNASAALKGFPSSGAFAMACHAKSGLAQSMARELMPQGIHVANVPIDAAIGWTQEDGTRAHRRAGTTVDDNMADPASRKPICNCIASTGRHGRSKSCSGRGPRNGDAHLLRCGFTKRLTNAFRVDVPLADVDRVVITRRWRSPLDEASAAPGRNALASGGRRTRCRAWLFIPGVPKSANAPAVTRQCSRAR